MFCAQRCRALLAVEEYAGNFASGPADSNAPTIYKFSRYSASQYDKSEMIFQSGKTLRRGQPLEGYLLAIDPEPIPGEIRHGTDITAKLTIV